MIRSATETDLPDLLEMVGLLAAHHGDTSVATLDTLRRDLMGGDWGHALIDDTRRGYAALIPRASLQYGARGMDMHHLFVRADARGTGLGRALVAACESHVRGIGGRFLLVGTSPDNMAAQAFYLSQGFERRKGRDNEFSKRLD